MTMPNELIKKRPETIVSIFRRSIPTLSGRKTDAKRIEYCQRCGKWMTHFLSYDRFDEIKSEILRLDKDKEIYKWTNDNKVKFELCGSCNNDMLAKHFAGLDIDKMTIGEFKITYKLKKNKEGKVYDFIGRNNRKI